MINISIYQNEQDEYTGFRMEGHAGYAKRGQDIVCAAVSVLVINTINSLDQITGEKMNVESDENSGIIRCRLVNHPLKETSKALMDSLVLGLSQIEKQYGKNYCKLTFEEV